MSIKLFLPAAVIIIAVMGFFHFLTTPLLFESEESKTLNGSPVFNEVQWKPSLDKEVWSMRQSHEGRKFAKEKWDSLAIIVEDKASYYQLKPGTDERIEYRVSCFMCHSNGPRAMRPVKGSLSFANSIKVSVLNLRIKLYGRIHAKELPQIGQMPFRHQEKISNTPLTLSTCTSCHRETGFFARGYLTRQNAITIKHMVENNHMPPIGSMTSEEKTYLENFLNGF